MFAVMILCDMRTHACIYAYSTDLFLVKTHNFISLRDNNQALRSNAEPLPCYELPCIVLMITAEPT
jgi:hypothetical protein